MPSDEDEMLRGMGLRAVDDLFADMPSAVRIPKLGIPDGLPEDRVVARVTSILAANRTVVDMPAFLGGGLYDHFVPASVRAVVSRSEFYTSHTPYQPEISQGLLQALWEYQSLICELTGMDAANTSMYDGSTALGEAARMAHRIHGGRIFLVPRGLRHNRRAVLANYILGAGLEVREVDYHRESGMLDLAKLKTAMSPDGCGVYVENPNFFGRFEGQLEEIHDMTTGGLVVGRNRIDRALAVSNIRANQSLVAVAAAAYMAVLGSNGLRRVAAENIRRAKELAAAIDKIAGFDAPLFPGAHFNEFVVRRKKGYAAVHRALLDKGIHGGLPLTRQLPELSDAALFATTGRHTPEAVGRLLAALEAFR